MGSYIRKVQKTNKTSSSFVFVYGIVDVPFKGEYKQLINRDIEYFSNDLIDCLGNNAKGADDRTIGVNKNKWRFNRGFKDE